MSNKDKKYCNIGNNLLCKYIFSSTTKGITSKTGEGDFKDEWSKGRSWRAKQVTSPTGNFDPYLPALPVKGMTIDKLSFDVLVLHDKFNYLQLWISTTFISSNNITPASDSMAWPSLTKVFPVKELDTN